MKKNINDLQKLLEKREVKTPEEKEQKEYLNKVFRDNQLFFKLDTQTALSILYFLGINEDQLLDYYFELIDPVNFKIEKGTYTMIPPPKSN